MSDENIVELGTGKATVDSVITRLDRYKSKIKSITAVVTWEDGLVEVCYEVKESSKLAFDALVIQHRCLEGEITDEK